jgi:hypothetical protein
MLALLITYLPQKKHLVSKSADGAFKVYYKLDSHHNMKHIVDEKVPVRVYHREKDDTNFTFLGESNYHILFDVEDQCSILNVFFPPGSTESRKLFTKENDYVGAVAKDCKFDGIIQGEMFES